MIPQALKTINNKSLFTGSRLIIININIIIFCCCPEVLIYDPSGTYTLMLR